VTCNFPSRVGACVGPRPSYRRPKSRPRDNRSTTLSRRPRPVKDPLLLVAEGVEGKVLSGALAMSRYSRNSTGTSNDSRQSSAISLSKTSGMLRFHDSATASSAAAMALLPAGKSSMRGRQAFEQQDGRLPRRCPDSCDTCLRATRSRVEPKLLCGVQVILLKISRLRE
jgi:hypothetical protein